MERKEEEEAIHERTNATVGVLSPSREFSREFSLSCPRSTDSKHSIRSFVTFDGTVLGIGLICYNFEVEEIFYDFVACVLCIYLVVGGKKIYRRSNKN